MRTYIRLGSVLATCGLLILGSLAVLNPARADVLALALEDLSPDTSSTAGGQIFEITGQNLLGVVKVTFGDEESQILLTTSSGVYLAGVVPSHKAGVVPVTVYFDASTVGICPNEDATAGISDELQSTATAPSSSNELQPSTVVDDPDGLKLDTGARNQHDSFHSR